MSKYFLYARKSTDVDDKQILSIEAQLSELRALAKREGLEIATEFTEKRTAKVPGRPIFNDMMNRIQNGEAQGIICWKLDRLARNPVDDGLVSWLLQQKVMERIATPERSYYSADNVLTMSVEFGMANQYVRDLAVNTARGLRQKARNGHYPSVAPLGYLNDPRTKTIAVDRKKSKIVRAAFELYAQNGSRLEDVSRFLFENGIATKATKRWENSGLRPLKKDQAKLILTNSFYYGHFRYAGEIYEGKHTPIIAKELFDRVQKVLALRGRAQKPTKQPQALCGLLKCGECGCSITCEEKFKYQKNGNVHRYVYYRCTKKRGACSDAYIREETLDAQLSKLLSRFHLPRHWAEELERMATKDAADASQTTAASVQAMRAKIADLNGKIARITDLFVEQDIERGDYLERKRALMSDKKSVQERILLLEANAAVWLEPMRKWLKDASLLDEAAQSKDLPSKKLSLQKIFGSNLTLHARHAREARGVPANHWFSVAAATENQSKTDLVSCLVRPEGLEPPTNRV
ncbi:MAG: Recombinase [Candidatus Adlerbacteria bacterium GW2011_GWB1_54_7]|uniref:Recombinase n=1 Tax=Candidatus Adlerbacteria bacterium GW2011_GWB1_54_7 TaxID=1618607 RepID=A0A0G1Y1S3_9BACT|nr:MAG: Recombinase [Candidatus Adlerbacteria bacterium GW2011_GWB1_54_7]